MSDRVYIDGSYGEGGGQILRTSAALAAITGRPVEIANIRANRSRPGLQPQHLMAVQAAGDLCGAAMRGAAPGSQYLLMEPTHDVRAGDYRFDIGTAGSTLLVLQTVFTPLVLAGGVSRVVVTGGTHNDHAPCAEFVERVFLPCLRKAGVRSHFDYSTAGYFPRGGGEIRVEIEAPNGLSPLDLKSSRRGKVEGYAVTSQLPDHVAERAIGVLERVAQTVEIRRKPSVGPGAATFACIEGLAGFTGLGKRGVTVEKVADESVSPMRNFIRQGAQVDEHLADQLVLPLCFANGPSRYTTWRATEHLRTVAWVVSQFGLGPVAIEERTDGGAEVRIPAS